MEEYLSPAVLQPDIYWNGLRIQEPVVAATSLLVTAVCWYAAWRLGRTAPANSMTRWLRLFFILMGCSTLTGGLLGHAFMYRLDMTWKLPSWILSMAAVAALGQAAINHARPLLGLFVTRSLVVMNGLFLVICLYLAVVTLFFPYVEMHAGFGLLVIMGTCEAYVYRKKRDPGSRLMLLSILPLVAAVAVHIAKFSPHIWFIYFDVGHVLMCVSILLMLRAGEEIKFAGTSPPSDGRRRAVR